MSAQHPNILIVARLRNHSAIYETLALNFAEFASRIYFMGSRDILEGLQEKLKHLEGKVHFFMSENEGVSKLVRHHHKAVRDCHAAIFDEYYGNPVSFLYTLSKISKHIKKIAIVHNANSWLLPKINVRLRNVFNVLARQKIMRQMDAILVMSPLIREYIQKNKAYSKGIYCIPFNQPDQAGKSSQKKNGCLMVCIPGAIGVDRRDYDMVLDAFENLWKQDKSIRLKLLGYASSHKLNQDVVARCRDLQNKFGVEKLTFWDNFIPSDEFNREIMGADVILNNNKVYTVSAYGTTELYGLTKQSGIAFFIINFAKAAVVPEKLIVDPYLNRQVLRYTDKETLQECVLKLAENRDELTRLQRSAAENMKYYKSFYQSELKALEEYLKK